MRSVFILIIDLYTKFIADYVQRKCVFGSNGMAAMGTGSRFTPRTTSRI